MAKWDLSKLPEGRKPLPDEWFAERAQMQERIKALEAKMSDEPLMLKLEEVEHHENGDATYKFDMNERVAKDVAALGLKLLLYCGVAKVDVEDVFGWILSHSEGGKDE